MPVMQQQAIAAEVLAALESGTLELPTLPEVALKIRDAIDDPNVSAQSIVRLLSTDPVISAQIIRTANSAAFSNGNPVNDVSAAVTRLGYRMLRNLVMVIAMEKLFKVSSPIINRELQELWAHSREVAANSYVLALHQKHLKPEQAMLAGMMHDLGALPLCIYGERHHPRLDQHTLEGLIRRFHTEVGAKLLTAWHFPQDVVDVVAEHENLQRVSPGGQADYIDVVTVANLMLPGRAKFVAWENVRAAKALGYTPAQCRDFLDTHAEQLAVVREILGFTSAKPAAEKPTLQPQPAPALGPRPSAAAQNDKPESTTGVLSGLFRLFK